MNLQIVEVKFDEEDQDLILLCSLSNLFEYVDDTMLYGRATITFIDVMDSLMSKELMHRVNEEDSNSSMFVCRVKHKKERVEIRGSQVPYLTLLVRLNVVGARNEDILKKFIHGEGRETVRLNQATMLVLMWFKIVLMKV